ncbi:MAG: RNA polymerase sigma factor [bacterium]|nr:RNA polymerase sigma factor [bacterium]
MDEKQRMTARARKLEQLAQKAKLGDQEAFSELMKAKMNEIIAMTYKMTGDRQSAADLAQETFISAWKNLGSFRGDSSVSSWLYRIAANKTLNHLKREKKFSSNEPVEQVSRQTLEQSPEDPSRLLEKKRLRNQVLDFMQTLPIQQRLAFELRFYKQLSFAEISDTTGSALGTVKTNYREAVKKLRKHATEKGWRE